MNPFINAKRLFTYEAYVALTHTLFEQNLTTGSEQSAAKLEATSLNIQRMKRITKTTEIQSFLQDAINKIEVRLKWFVISEAWCGDSAQIVPILNRISEYSAGKIEMKIVLRDENPQIMEQYLTNGNKSIPKVVMFADDIQVATWGPRPQFIQHSAMLFKKENPDAPHNDFLKNLHLLYTRDKGLSVQEEFCSIIEKHNKKQLLRQIMM